MNELMSRLATQSSVPVMVDTTETKVARQALTWLGGKAILNSVNLEEGDGPARAWTAFSHSPPSSAPRWWRRASTRRVKRAPRTGRSAPPRPLPTRVSRYGLDAQDIFIDPSPFPCRRAWSSRAATASRPSRRFDASRLSYRACAPFSDFRSLVRTQSRRAPGAQQRVPSRVRRSGPRRRDRARVKILPLARVDEEATGLPRSHLRSSKRHLRPLTELLRLFEGVSVSSQNVASLDDLELNEPYADASSRAHELASRTTSPGVG